MQEPIQYSTKLDIQRYNNVRFTLMAIKRENPDIEISIDYGPSHDEDNVITAIVWARIVDSPTRHFLYKAHLPGIDLEDYVSVAVQIHNSPEFLHALEETFEKL